MYRRFRCRAALWFAWMLAVALGPPALGQSRPFELPLADYEDRVQAVWTAQMLAALMGFPFEHKVASVRWVDSLDRRVAQAPVDDDWYYEMVAIRGFEKYGVNMTVQELGQQWLDNAAGTWGSSEQARLLMGNGILPPDCGHPRYNKLWFTIGPQFSSDVYGALAPAMPNLAGRIAREYGHINGYAEGADGGVFIAGMVSLAFAQRDPRVVVKEAARLIHPASPYRQCLDVVIHMAEQGRSAPEIFEAVEQRWHRQYPATNNAVANGGLVAASVWFGEGDFLKTINLAFGAADFSDADCNAANAAAVIGAMHGMKALPAHLVGQLGDLISDDRMGTLVLTPPVKESISGLARRTVAVGMALVQQNGARLSGGRLQLPFSEVVTQPAELFSLSDLMRYWQPEWRLERAGFGGALGGMPGIRGITYLDGAVLATYPDDEVRGVVLSRTLEIGEEQQLLFEAGVDSGRVWRCAVYVNNEKLLDKVLEGSGPDRTWYPFTLDLERFRNTAVTIRMYQRVLVPGRASGNAYWKNLQLRQRPAGGKSAGAVP